MDKNEKIRQSIRKLKPVEAFEKYSEGNEYELLQYYKEQHGITNIGEMCEEAFESCRSSVRYYSDEEIYYIVKFMQKHLENFIQSFEGCENATDLKDISEKQLEEEILFVCTGSVK